MSPSGVLGSWLGTGLAGSVLDARLLAEGTSFELSTVILLVITLTGPGYREEDPRDDHEGAEHRHNAKEERRRLGAGLDELGGSGLVFGEHGQLIDP